MHRVVEDLEVTKTRQAQVKEMFLLLMDWTSHELEKDEPKCSKVRHRLIESTLESSIEQSKGYLEQLKAEENMIQLHYADLEEQKRDNDTILNLHKSLSGFNVKRVSTDYDADIDLNISRFVVDLKAPSNRSVKESEALIELAGANHQLTYAGKKYSLSSNKDLQEIQSIVKETYY